MRDQSLRAVLPWLPLASLARHYRRPPSIGHGEDDRRRVAGGWSRRDGVAKGEMPGSTRPARGLRSRHLPRPAPEESHLWEAPRMDLCGVERRLHALERSRAEVRQARANPQWPERTL